MDKADMAIAERCRRQWSVVARWQLEDDGLTGRQIDHRVANRELLVVHAGVYRHAAAPVTDDGRLVAAVLAAGRAAVASHRSAARRHGLEVRGFRPEVLTTDDHAVHLGGLVVHRTKLLGPEDVDEVRGIPCTTVARTLLDLGAVLPFESVEAVAQDAIIRRLTTIPQLLAVLDRLGRRGRPGTAALRAIVRQSLPDERLESELERRLVDLVMRAGLPRPTLQHEVRLPDGATARLDMAWPGAMHAVEGEGRRWHASKRDFERSMTRRRSLQALGWTIHPYGWTDVVEATPSVLAELRALSPILTRSAVSRTA